MLVSNSFYKFLSIYKGCRIIVFIYALHLLKEMVFLFFYFTKPPAVRFFYEKKRYRIF